MLLVKVASADVGMTVLQTPVLSSCNQLRGTLRHSPFAAAETVVQLSGGEKINTNELHRVYIRCDSCWF